MGPHVNQSPMTLSVQNLAKARSFYLSALAPLDYSVISEVRHIAVAGSFPDSQAVGLGPHGTNRVDLFLSESASDRLSHVDPAHVVFPASSRIAVREFYAAALKAGAGRILRPEDEAGGVFTTTVADLDGNKIEVAYSDPQSSAPPDVESQGQGQTIQRWREDVASSSGSSASMEGTYRLQNTGASAQGGPRSTRTASVTHQYQENPRHRASSPGGKATSNNNNNYTNAVIGTTIGAAAGAALAYGLLRSKNDSVAKDRDFASRMEARQRGLRDEAWAHQRRSDQEVESTRRRSNYPERDSGYYSEKSLRRSDQSPSRVSHRTITYPDVDQRRGRTTDYKLIENRPKATSPISYRDAPRRQSSVRESSQSTVRPPRRSASIAGPRGYEVARYESSPPSMPPLPFGRSRRDSRGSGSYGSRHRGEPLQIEGPPPSYSERRRSESHRAESRTRDATPGSHTSVRTARRVPLPESVAPLGARKSQISPAAPPSAASAALTAKALSEKEGLDGIGAGSKAGRLDDLKTIVPDDSISCAPTVYDYTERKERDRGSRTSRQRSRTSRHDDLPRTGTVRG